MASEDTAVLTGSDRYHTKRLPGNIVRVVDLREDCVDGVWDMDEHEWVQFNIDFTDLNSELSIDEKLTELGDRWGSVYISYRPDSTPYPHTVRNHTDEGLGLQGQDRKTAYGESLDDALTAALARRFGFPE
jgi:hypothetical protein